MNSSPENSIIGKLNSSIEIENDNQINSEAVNVQSNENESYEESGNVNSSVDIRKTYDEKSLQYLKSNIQELRILLSPPQIVKTVMETVCILFNQKADWDNSKKLLVNPNLFKNLESYDKNNISQSTMNKLKPYIESEEFEVDRFKRVSTAAAGLASKVIEIYNYSLTVNQSLKDSKSTCEPVQYNDLVDSNEELRNVNNSVELDNKTSICLENKKTILCRDDIRLLKCFNNPPKQVKLVMDTVCILFNQKADWNNSKKLLADINLLKNLESYEKNNISQSTMNKLKPYIESEEFNIEYISKAAQAAGGLASLVLEIYNYSLNVNQISKDTESASEAMKSTNKDINMKCPKSAPPLKKKSPIRSISRSTTSPSIHVHNEEVNQLNETIVKMTQLLLAKEEEIQKLRSMLDKSNDF